MPMGVQGPGECHPQSSWSLNSLCCCINATGPHFGRRERLLQLGLSKKPRGNAYATIAEARLLEILEPIALPGTRKRNIERELTHTVNYSKEFSRTMKPHMHSAVTSEAQSLLLDA